MTKSKVQLHIRIINGAPVEDLHSEAVMMTPEEVNELKEGIKVVLKGPTTHFEFKDPNGDTVYIGGGLLPYSTIKVRTLGS